MINKTFIFNNCRFFAPLSQGGSQSGGRGWVRISAMGRRETLPGIDRTRAALVVIDMQWG